MERHQFTEAELSFAEGARIPFAIYQFLDKRVVTLALSAGFCDLFGYELPDAYDLMDNDMYRDTHPDDVARISGAAFRFATGDGEYNVVYRTKRDGVYRVVHAFGEHIYTDDGARLAVVWYVDEGVSIEGVDEFRRELNEALDKMLSEEAAFHKSYYDRLTGLPSMSRFFELAEAGRKRLLANGEDPAFLFINLTGMKVFNHRYGFAEGDKLISSMAKVLASRFGSESCARVGKDHFVVFTAAADLEDVLWDVFDEFEGANDGRNLPVQVGIYIDRSETADIVMACDKAQYACKLEHDSYVSGFRYFNDEMMAVEEHRQYIIDNVDRAIEEGWIQIYYQAIVRASNGRVCDEEALARWIDPEEGFLPPADFIPVLEETRLIYKLDLYVVDQVIAKMKRQADEGIYVVPQSVNLSRTDFDSLDIVEEIRRRVDAAGIPREKLTIEITESAVASDFAFMKDQIEAFQKLGFRVWMDDFGSGYSSLDVLQDIHFDLIKLDMRFVAGIDSDDGDDGKVIITELVRLAMGLGVDTLAEGVETKEQADFLKEIGCGRLQGFYYTKPIPVDEIVDRDRKGITIGFENPDEAGYYAAIGKINLYDMGVIAHESGKAFQQYFDTAPMAIYEISQGKFCVIRSNKPYRDFMEQAFGAPLAADDYDLTMQVEGVSSPFLDALRQCAEDGRLIVVDEEVGDGKVVHSVAKRVAVNPVTGTAAVVVSVVAITESTGQSPAVTYAGVAQALSSDYRHLYYVDLETEKFIEYSSSGAPGDLSIERHGDGFFQACVDDAQTLLYNSDIDRFVRAFTKENVMSIMDSQGAFMFSYRQMMDGEPLHMLLKAVRIGGDDSHIIVGVSDVDAQMKQRDELERMKSERAAYARITALSDDYICVYIVDPLTENYEEYSATGQYEGLGLAKAGDAFFERAREESAWALPADDVEMFNARFTKDNVLGSIERDGSFGLNYRLLIDGEPTEVVLKAVAVVESDETRLIIGVRIAVVPDR